MAGARFVRADLHVHTFPDSDREDVYPISDYVRAAVDRGVDIVGITDHNTTRNVREAIAAFSNSNILLLPGIEVTTHDGHLLALFAPTDVESLEEFASRSNLQLAPDPLDRSLRSVRGMLDLIGEIARRGGLAIPAHVDRDSGIGLRTNRTALIQILTSPGLAGIEFSSKELTSEWFAEDDQDVNRRDAWRARQGIRDLQVRGLARLMSSDAHSPNNVGIDTSRKTLTRLRIDHLNFDAVRNALLFNPKARCKVEAVLPRSYPRIQSADFTGGFLDGVHMDFSENLTCIIGGRGSGKSTALIAVRAALGADLREEDDPDESERMPDKTLVHYIDELGSERVAERSRHEEPIESGTSVPIELKLADLSQGESGQLARGHETDPASLLDFLDQFCEIGRYEHREKLLNSQLADNGAEVERTSRGIREIPKLEKLVRELEGSLAAAERGKIDEVARWAARLSSEGPLLDKIHNSILALTSHNSKVTSVNLDQIARETGADLSVAPARDFIEGPNGLRGHLAQLSAHREMMSGKFSKELIEAGQSAQDVLREWKKRHDDLTERLDRKEKELEAKGLRIEAGAARAIAARLSTARADLKDLQDRRVEHNRLRRERKNLLKELRNNRGSLFQHRRARIRSVVKRANETSDGLTIHITCSESGDRTAWATWLGGTFKFRTPRVQRIAESLTPGELAEALVAGKAELLTLTETDGTVIFDDNLIEQAVRELRTWPTIFDIETMRLRDRVRISVQEPGSVDRRPFDHLSAGQQRSVLLGLMLCAANDEPLVIDQPEDHLDARYIATAIVRHLELAKERRQVILATHNANLTVLGDAELVIPLYAERRRGKPIDVGAVDRPETRARVCELLEGGTDAFLRRAERYGIRLTE